MIRKRSGVEIAEPQPRVKLTTTEIGKQRVVITLFCPTSEAFQMERAVSAVVLGEYWRRRNGVAAPSTHTPQEKP
ncbi:MAG: hypothetical protein U5L11_16890 [Arhodomonas sp.]|nr:hypothetical protein [Arhodomonas sp.]